ncbi:MAG: alkaline phosphatase [Deltaproteobacteria bacterium]|nr:alkaline phosphatase [Deltaproteobacteria bacterium]
MIAACLSAACEPPPDAAADGSVAADAADRADGGARARRIVILLIGDGMGRGQIDAASLYRQGATGRLHLQSLPVHAEVVTGNLSGITDSAAAATALATGELTWNGSLGIGRHGLEVENLVELAHRRGQRAGIVTTALLPHATPAGFTAHQGSRADYLLIAEDEALGARPEVLLGGGSAYYDGPGSGSLREAGDLVESLQDRGYGVVRTASELGSADPAEASGLLGLFASDHMTWVLDRPEDTTEPTLAEMSAAALRWLDAGADSSGFFLMIEGARIDMACHGNDLERAIHETLAFDDAVRTVTDWADGRPEVTVLVTADHETGGLEILEPSGAGELPQVRWRWTQHSNARVDLFASGPGVDGLADRARDQRWIHATIVSLLSGEPLAAPPPALVADGNLVDLRYRAAEQIVTSGFGAGYNQLDALWLDADEEGLSLGVEGLFEWDHNAVVALIDVDLGAGTGPAALAQALSDPIGRLDGILSSSSLLDPGVDGWGADWALASFGGSDPRAGDRWDDGGLRGLTPASGAPDDLFWGAAATNFGEGVRTRGDAVAASPSPGEGWEARIAWSQLYPTLGGQVPPGATLGIAAVLVNDDGGYTSNQALPPFPDGTENPGRSLTPLPGVVRFVIDSDLDGLPDVDLMPTVVEP